MATSVHRGSCLCNGIIFEITGAPQSVFACYCNDCQKNAGGPYQICAKLESTQIKILSDECVARVGNWVIEETKSGHNKVKAFCQRCGCTLWTIPMHHEGRIMVVRAALFEKGLETFKPTAELFVPCKPSYLESIGGTKKFDTMPGY